MFMAVSMRDTQRPVAWRTSDLRQPECQVLVLMLFPRAIGQSPTSCVSKRSLGAANFPGTARSGETTIADQFWVGLHSFQGLRGRSCENDRRSSPRLISSIHGTETVEIIPGRSG